ncbi:MAG: DNA internalization-related competence protein ComEC/Rec2 [Candidatus Ozemobacter sibiricus]|uniref:DNA internalization-related competence protein ComEC/Rec2 n=1 Tax=Candidatus Ozemobacter sibiricus TaxID=2268124 RepID=A0A367ZKG3_9BACT|nr:MAG: DNA internalization-related competence protein ComEC/Rec2 [Candidatus Ozemobacter sibiricus]
MTFLDVGQGDAILIRTAEKTILIDAGDDRVNAANGVIIPYLKREGITRIDTCIISHPHRDHFGGFIDLLQAIPIGEFQFSSDTLGTGDPEESSSDALVYMRMYNLIKEKKIPYNKVPNGAILNWGRGIKVEVLHADETPRRSADQPPRLIQRGEVIKSPANEQSLIIKATAGKISYLFTGDAEKGAEGRAIELFREKLPSTILKSGHHGSKTSSTYPFMDLVKPEYGIISVGTKNSFGHPNKETLEKYAFYKMKVFRTDQDGTIDTFTDGTTVQVVSNQSPLAITKPPEIISLTANSATIQWTTNKTSNSVVKYGTSGYTQQKVLDPFVTVHTVTLTGLKPSTTYLFQAISQDERQPEQVVSIEGRLTTPAGSDLPLPKIVGMGTTTKAIYLRKPFTVQVDLKNPANEPQKNFALALYHSSMADVNLLGTTNVSLAASGQGTLTFPVELSWLGKVELIAVLTNGKDIIDTSSIVVDVLPKNILVDCAHGNIDYFTGRFAGMKMDLYNRHGFSMKSISKLITPAALEGSFVLIMPEPKEALAAEEIAAIKEYVSKGGSVLFFLKSDYKDLSAPHLVNPILQAIGSRIRFNDDQFCDPTNNIGPPFRAFVHVFPDPIIQGVNQLLFRSSCTLVNHQMQGLTASKDLHLLAVGDDDSYNVDTDNMNDCSFYYASATPRLPIPVVAAEDLGTGRVACFAEPLYDDRLYADPKIPTALFNSQVVAWLATAREKTLRDLLRSLDNLESIDDPDLRASRFDGLRAAALDQIQQGMAEGAEADIQAAFQEYASPAVQDLARDLRHTLQFRDLHQDRP